MSDSMGLQQDRLPCPSLSPPDSTGLQQDRLPCPSLSPTDSTGLQQDRLSCPSLSPTVWSHLCSLSQWCYLTVSSSAAPFSFYLQSFPAFGSFTVSQLLASGVFAKYWSFSFSSSSSFEYSGLISFRIGWFDLLAVQGTQSRVFSSTTVWKHQFFSAQPSLWSNFHICTWLLEKS